MKGPAGEVSFKLFAKMLGERSPSYVTQLKDAGRLVLSADGKRVCVDESLALIRATADPAKTGVVARHAAARGTEAPIDADDGAASDDGATAPTGDVVQDSHARRRAKALADKAETDAKVADRDYRISMGELLAAADVEQAARHAAATFRGAIENLPNTLAPELAAVTDEGRVRVVLAEALEHALEELSRAFAAIGRREVDA